MKAQGYAFGFFMALFVTVSCTAAMPAWVVSVGQVLDQTQQIEEMLKDDVTLYMRWTKILECVAGDFDKRETERAKLFAVVREKVSLLQSQLALSEADKASKLEENDSTIRELQDSIGMLRQETQQEIVRLNTLAGTLNTQIDQARQAYADLVTTDEEQSEQLITELTVIKNAYNAMIDERALFMATLDRFVKKTKQFMTKSSEEMTGLGVELIGVAFHDSEPIVDQPISHTDYGPCDESEMETDESEIAAFA